MFIWKFFGDRFENHMSKLKQLKAYKHISILERFFVPFCVILFLILVLCKHSFVYHLGHFDHLVRHLESRPDFLFKTDVYNAVFVMILAAFDRWLQIAIYTSTMFMMLIYLCFYNEYKYIFKDMGTLVKSGNIYKAKSFSQWRKKYQELSLLVEDFDECMRLSASYAIFFGISWNHGSTLQYYIIMR